MARSPSRQPGAAAWQSSTAIGTALRSAARFDRSAVSFPAGLIAAIPLIAVFGVPIAAGDPAAGATMAAGAMLVGIAWRVAGGRPPLMLMSTDALLMALSTFVGSATGSRTWLHLIVVAVWALAAGLLVAVGRRGAVMGTQAVIGIVVFGRFARPPLGAIEIAGLVLAGGLAMVVFVALVRWPSPLKLQRRAVADACRALAEPILAPIGASTIPAAERLDEARMILSAPALFGDPAVLSLRGLADEGARLRIELRAIQLLLERAQAPVSQADDRTAPSAVHPLLRLSADVLKVIAAAVEGDREAIEQLPELSRRTTALEDQMADGVLERPLRRRMAAVGGQLRAMLRLAEAAGRRQGPLARRPRATTGVVGEGLRHDLAEIRANATLSSPAGRHAVRLAVVVVLAELLSEHIPLQRSYWVVVAAATVLRPDFASTFTRGAERMIGTSAGVALAGLILVGLHPSLGVAVPIVGLFGWLAYAVFPASFAVGFAFVTTLVVFLLDAVTPDTLAVAGDRLIDTILGGAIGLIAYAIWPTWSRGPAQQALAQIVSAQRLYLSCVMSALTNGTPEDQAEMGRLARRARRAYSAAQETVALSLDEPAARRIDSERSQGMLAALRRLVSVIHLLRIEAQEGRPRHPMPALGRLAGDLDQTLQAIAAALPESSHGAAAAGIAPPVPDLRESYTRLTSSGRLEPAEEPTLRELDELVDAVNSLSALTTVPSQGGTMTRASEQVGREIVTQADEISSAQGLGGSRLAAERAPQALTSMAAGFMRGKALCAAVRLGVPDALCGEMTTAELATAVEADPAMLERLLRALASIGVIREADGGRFALTELGQPLRRDAPDSVWASMVFWADLIADSWTYLADCVRAGGRQGADEARAREEISSRWSREPQAGRIFTTVFAESGIEENLAYVRSWDLGAARSVADLGGAGGGLLAALLTAHPHLRGVLVDRPEAIEAAARSLDEAGLTDRSELIASDLLERVPAGVDVYVMRSVLHGYDDRSAQQILASCRSAMAPGSRLLVVEVVLPDRLIGPDAVLESMFMADLNMLAVTGGRERTRSQWQQLLARAGLQMRDVRPVQGLAGHSPVESHHSTIEAVPGG